MRPVSTCGPRWNCRRLFRYHAAQSAHDLAEAGHKLTGLDVRGILEGGKPFVAILQPEPGKSRRLRAESLDAGQLFKLVGFYPPSAAS